MLSRRVDNGAFIISGDLFGTIDRAADDDAVAAVGFVGSSHRILMELALTTSRFEYDVDDPNGHA